MMQWDGTFELFKARQRDQEERSAEMDHLDHQARSEVGSGPTPMDEVMNRLSTAVAELGDNLDRLAMRLGPVLREVPEAALARAEDKTARVASSLVRAVDDQADLLYRMTTSVQRLAERLDL